MEVVLALPGDPQLRSGVTPESWSRIPDAGRPGPGAHPARKVLAIDGGYRLARELGLDVAELIGDLDSVSADDLAHAAEAGVSIDRWPQRKDFTDLELGLRRAEALGATSITCLGGAGGRVDHLFTNLFVLAGAAARTSAAPIRWIAAEWTAEFVTPAVRLDRSVGAGALFSVLAPLGDAVGVTISGASYPLDRATLAAGTGLGLSNVASGGPLGISVETGTVAVVWPFPEHPSESAPPKEHP